jgi:hypothetical protein
LCQFDGASAIIEIRTALHAKVRSARFTAALTNNLFVLEVDALDAILSDGEMRFVSVVLICFKSRTVNRVANPLSASSGGLGQLVFPNFGSSADAAFTARHAIRTRAGSSGFRQDYRESRLQGDSGESHCKTPSADVPVSRPSRNRGFLGFLRGEVSKQADCGTI